MKVSILYIFSFFLLFVSCSVEQGQQLVYEGATFSDECRTIQVRMPENWKIVNAQLEFKQMNLEFDRGKGIEKQSLPIPFQFDDFDKNFKFRNENIKFRGANRLDGLTLLHFTTKEDPQSEFNPPIGTSKVTTSIREREEFTIFRTSNWLVIHYSIKKTSLGDLIHHNIRRRYAKNPNNKEKTVSFKTIDGKMHYNLVFNNQEKRSFLIDNYYGQHETYNSSSLSQSRSNSEISWTWHYKIASNVEMDR